MGGLRHGWQSLCDGDHGSVIRLHGLPRALSPLNKYNQLVVLPRATPPWLHIARKSDPVSPKMFTATSAI